MPFVILVCVFIMCSAHASVSAGPIVSIDSGLVEGVSHGTYNTYFGIPFAQAKQRYATPVPVLPWGSVRPAMHRAPACAQPGFPGAIQDDCLFLDVWQPNALSNSTKTAAALVFFHGGGFFLGASSNYNASALLRNDDTVVFVVNYRLGAFGFLPQRPNLGLVDQMTSLEWVQRNCKAFSCDRARVTIAGESAGGGSVLVHLVSPLSQGLFSSAVAMSPATSQQLSCSKMLHYGTSLMEVVNCTNVDCLESISIDALLAGFMSVFPSRGFTAAPFAPCVDGYVLPKSVVSLPLPTNIPLLIGRAKNEGALIGWLDASIGTGVMDDRPERALELFALLSQSSFANLTTLLNLYSPKQVGSWSAIAQAYGDMIVNCVCDWLGSRILQSHRYVFDSFDPMASNAYLGATHAMDLPFWFGNRSIPFGLLPGVPQTFSPQYEALSDRMISLLLSFNARPGNSSTVVVFSEKGDTVIDSAPPTPACQMWLKLYGGN
jgi:para-nitrobenzyl esterase